MSSSNKDLLSKGLDFGIPPKLKDYSNFIAEFKLLYLYRSTLDLSMKTEEKDRFKTKLKDIALSSFKLFSDNCKFENNLSAGEINSFKALLRNKDIIIQKANKDNTVVISDKEKCIEGVKLAISHSSKFFQLNITPYKYLSSIINVEKKFKQLFKNLLDNDKISKDEYDKICPKRSRPGIRYANHKIHKLVVNNLPKF